MSPKVRTQHGEVTTELAWSGSGSWSEITPAVGRTVHYPPPHYLEKSLTRGIFKIDKPKAYGFSISISHNSTTCNHIILAKSFFMIFINSYLHTRYLTLRLRKKMTNIDLLVI
ncbi:hypothetical protein Hanom_Chr04g00308231 [Helianthus anomalus]